MRHRRRRCGIRNQCMEPSLVTCVLRPPTVEELPTLSALCLRSKAVWGYGNDFMEACRSELTIEACELQSSSIAVAEENGKIVGLAQVKVTGSEADLVEVVCRADDASRWRRNAAIPLGYPRSNCD